MRIIYPENPLNHREADDPYQAEYLVASAAGLNCALFNFDDLAFGKFNPRPNLLAGESVLYRGWMLNSEGYRTLVAQIQRQGGVPITTHHHYLQCHHLPGWYDACQAFTSETQFFEYSENLEQLIDQLGWDGYFVKDFVKSNSTAEGSMATTPAQAVKIIALIKQYRGEIEGGVAIRKLEQYKPQTERRYFVVNGKPYTHTGDVPDLLYTIADRVKAPFYAVDLIETQQGELRLVEIGDGQVSAIKTWPILAFMPVLAANGQTTDV